ncbi:MAG: glycosyltransferase [Candidatus Levybacteria bacterium]|nr:glycosyltransferase [Candidatus Levybacteria bacterium]
MKIGFFTDGFLPQPNGVATSVFESAKELERRGHEVWIIAPFYPGYIDKSLNVIRLTSLKVFKEPEIRLALNLPDRAMRKVLSMDFDIIHGHSGGIVTLMGWEVARAKNIPFVVTYHTLWNRYTHYFLKGKVITPKMMERATKIFGNRVDFIIAPTGHVERELVSYGVRKPIKVVPSGINIDKFKEDKGGYLRIRLNLKKEPILLFVGRLGREKSVDFLIKSFKHVLAGVPLSQLVIIGEGPDKKKLKRQSLRLGVSKNTHFLGHIDSSEIQKAYKDASVFVFSSTTETQGLVVPEALASGVPVVAIADPAYECVEDGRNGFLVKKDPKEFSERVLKIINSKELREKMSEYARESVKKFSVKSTVDLLESAYYELLEKYNKESVERVMRQNERGEHIFVAFASFFATVLLTRFFILFSRSPEYPQFILGGSQVYHSQAALVVLVLMLATFIKRRKIGFLAVLLAGISLGLIVDELWSIIFAHETIKDYWSPLNLLPVISFSLLPIFISRFKKKTQPQFYIGLKEQKHVNPENPGVTVVVPAYNEENFIGATLKSLVNQTYKDFELIVVDNNSTDRTAEIAKKYGARVIVEKQRGVAKARNAGFKQARARIIASTDSDSIVPQDWVERIVAEFKKDEPLVAFGGLSNLYSGPVSARAAGRYLFKAFWIIDKLLSGGWNLAGFNMAVRKEAFLKIGGFNTSLTMGEDIDLAKRLREVGKVYVDTNSVVFVSGRRYKNGLLEGLMAYAPSWIARVLFHQDKFLNFPSIRSEKGTSRNLSYVPIILLVGIVSLFFILANS